MTISIFQGFVASVSTTRSFVPAIYDATVIIPKDQPSPTMMRILRGQSSVVSKYYVLLCAIMQNTFVVDANRAHVARASDCDTAVFGLAANPNH
jgi:hypothetical protein